MDESQEMWSGDWRARIKERLNCLGLATITEFLQTNPGMPYIEIARANELGVPVAALQLEWMQFAEADDPCKLRLAAMDSLARDLRLEGEKEGEKVSGTFFWTGESRLAILRVWEGHIELPKVGSFTTS